MSQSEAPTPNGRKNTFNFFRSQFSEDEYWEKYLAARPKYSPAFYDRILQYHRCAIGEGLAGQETIVHDVGTGPGNVAAVLAQHFDKVIATDLNENHLRVATQRNEALGKDLASKITYEHVGAEDVHSRYPPGSASFVAAAECMALLDVENALSSWATVLRPGGTLAVWFYGRPHFVEAADFDADGCQKIYNRIADTMFGKAIQNGGPAHQAGWKRATDCMASFLDNVHVPSSQWTDVVRWKWNSDWPMSFYGEAACDFEIDVTSKVQAGEVVEQFKERQFWGEDWSIADWKLFLKMNLPVFIEENDGSEIEQLWHALGEKMGGEHVKRAMGWPVVTILATRK